MKRWRLTSAGPERAKYGDFARIQLETDVDITLVTEVRGLGFNLIWNAAAWIECEPECPGGETATREVVLFDQSFGSRDDAARRAARFLVGVLP